MDAENSVDWKQWLEYARQDKRLAEAAREMKDLARNLILCTHQMVEHALKALYIYIRHELPPKRHNLPELAELGADAGFTISETEEEFLQLLDGYFKPVKYPQSAGTLPTHEKAVELFAEACRLLDRVEKELGQKEK